MDEDGINGADKDVGVRKTRSDRFVIPADVIREDLCFTVKDFDLSNKVVDDGLGVGDVTGRHDDHVAGSVDRDCAFTFGNMKHRYQQRSLLLWKVLAMVNTLSLLAVRDINHKSIVVGERGHGYENSN